MNFEILNPDSLGAPKGWNNGILVPAGARLLLVAGQAGWETENPAPPPGMVEQFARALDKVITVIGAAGGQPTDLARLTVYVTDLAAYRAGRRALGAVWRERFGRHYPAMALVAVAGLVDRGALVEMEATVVLGGAR